MEWKHTKEPNKQHSAAQSSLNEILKLLGRFVRSTYPVDTPEFCNLEMTRND